MRTIRTSTAFRRDHRKIKSTPRYRDLDGLLASVLEMLANDLRCHRITVIILRPATGQDIGNAMCGPTCF
jgi:hypothetical protein